MTKHEQKALPLNGFITTLWHPDPFRVIWYFVLALSFMLGMSNQDVSAQEIHILGGIVQEKDS